MDSYNFNNASARIKANTQKIKRVILEDMAIKADQYVPEDTGRTRIEMQVIHPNQSVVWSNEYVEYIFWGIQMNFQKTHNPKAQALWTERATRENIDSWAEQIADAIESGF